VKRKRKETTTMATKKATKKRQAEGKAKGKRQEAVGTATAEKADGNSAIDSPQSAIDAAQLVLIPVDAVGVVDQPRTEFDEPSLLELGESIEALGQMQPIIVVEQNNDMLLVAGERRLRAAKRIGHQFVRAMVYKKLSGRQVAEMQLAENFQRRDLNHMETARALGKLLAAGASTAEISAQVHKSSDFVREHLDLLRLAEPIHELVASGRLPVKQAAMIARVGDQQKQIELIRYATGLERNGGEWAPYFGRDDDPDDDVVSMAHLRGRIAEAMQSLAAAGWIKGEDADGEAFHPVKGRGCCTGCEDNSARYADQPTLFAGVYPKGSDKRGFCTHPSCYAGKRAEWDEILDARRKQREKDKAQKIKKARAAGLDVCEQCGKVCDPGAGHEFAVNETLSQKLCAKCEAKAKKRHDGGGGGGGSYEVKQKRIEALKKRFPWTEQQLLAVATYEWGTMLTEAVGKAIGEGRDPKFPAELVLWAQSRPYHYGNAQIPGGLVLQAEDAISGKLAAKDLAAFWLSACGWMSPYSSRPGIDYEGGVTWVPLPKDCMARINDLETICKAIGVEYEPRPTVESIAAEAVRDRILRGNKTDSLAAIAECGDLALLCDIRDEADSGGIKVGNKKLIVAKYKAAAITARIAELGGPSTGSTGSPQASSGQGSEPSLATDSELPATAVCKYCGCTEDRACTREGHPCSWTNTVCSVCQAEMITIAKGKRTDATLAIEECTSLALLKVCDEGGLKGDWRRAAVAKVRKTLTSPKGKPHDR